MCERHPAHKRFDEVMAKVIIIGRTYASGIERHAAQDGLRGVVRTLVESGAWLDPLLDDLRAIGDVPTTETVSALASAHGRVLSAIARADTRDGNRPRSFVSKYLHFHGRCFPIFDSLAQTRIFRRGWMKWPPQSQSLIQPPHSDPTYWRFCGRIAELAGLWQAEAIDDPPTSRNLDTFLLGEESLVGTKKETEKEA